MSEGRKLFIAVDYSNRHILLIAQNKAQLNREILELFDDDRHIGGAVWVYTITEEALRIIKNRMEIEGRAFNEVAIFST